MTSDDCPECGEELRRVLDASYDWLRCANCGYWVIVPIGESLNESRSITETKP